MRRLVLLIPLLLAAGCVKTGQPLSDPVTSEADESLYGHWVTTEQQDGKVLETHIFIGKHDVKNNPDGIMEAREVTWNKTENLVTGPKSPGYFTVTRLGTGTYINWFMAGGGFVDTADLSGANSYEAWAASKGRRCAILGYRSEKDKMLFLSATDPEAVEKVLKSGGVNFVDGVADVGGLIRYLKKNGGDRLFDAKPIVFARVR